MKSRLSILSLIVIVVLAFGSAAVACGGGKPLTLEEYFQRLEAISDDGSERTETLVEELEEGVGEASTDEEWINATGDFWLGLTSIIGDLIDGLKSLDPPQEAEDPHNDLVDAESGILEAIRELVVQLTGVESRSEAEELERQFREDADEFLERANEACLELQDLADENDIDVDLECEDDEDVPADGEDDEISGDEEEAPVAALAPRVSPTATPTVEAGEPSEAGDTVGRTQDDPVPVGQSLTMPEGWEIIVVDFIPDATQAVLDKNPNNGPPDPGFKYVIVRVRATNVSAGNPGEFVGAGELDATFALRLIGSRGIEYSTFSRSCGVVPDNFVTDVPDVTVTGGTLEGNVCFHVGVDETGFVMFTDFLLGRGARYFAVE